MGSKWVGMSTGKVQQQKYEAFLELLRDAVTKEQLTHPGKTKLKIASVAFEQYGLLPDGMDLIPQFLRVLETEGVIVPGSLQITQKEITSFEMAGRSFSYLSFEIVSDKYSAFFNPMKTALTYDPKTGVEYKTKRVMSFQDGRAPQKLFDVLWKSKVGRTASNEVCETAAKSKQSLLEESDYIGKGDYRSVASYRRRELDGLLRNSINRWNHAFTESKVPASIDEIKGFGFVLRAQCD